MTRQELDKKLKKAEQLLEKHKYLEARKLLRQIEQYKPVSLKTIVLSARYALMTGGREAAFNRLVSKWGNYFAYEGVDETLQLYEELWKSEEPDEWNFDRIHHMRKQIRFIGTDTEEARELQQNFTQLEEWGHEFYSTGSAAVLKKILRSTYTVSEVIWNYVIQVYFQNKGKSEYLPSCLAWVGNITNMGYFKERLEEPGAVFLLVAEESNEAMCRAVGRMLREMGKTVYLLMVPQQAEEESDVETLRDKSLKSRTVDAYGIHMVPTWFLEDAEGARADNRALLIRDLSRQAKGRLATVLGSGGMLDDLEMQACLRQSFSRLNMQIGDIFEDNFSIGWSGDYTGYISRIYNCDVAASLEDESGSCRYSIVIPARNSAESLRYTLKTCLELDYSKEDYEIVISDNSTGNNADVYNLCQAFQDSRIKYYRTPRDLHLPKSFEYAFLQAKGEFIFSIGSDDAVLPWALKVLDDVRSQYPQEEVIQWERGFYAWPGFNGGQENQFIIPGNYQKGNYNVQYRSGEDYLSQVLGAPDSMYGLPMLYINSGFKRSYMKTLLEKTGRLWDGICQDIYMGIVNILINDRILNIRYPLTIAGMTGKSIGTTCVQAHTEDNELIKFKDEQRKTGNIGGFYMSMTERLMPELRSDISSLYNSLLRAVARGILSENAMWERFEWKKMFWDCISRLDSQDMEYDKLIHYARYVASWHGNEFLQWFDQQIYDKVMEPRVIDTKQIEQMKTRKMYQEGPIAGGGVILDASDYGVTDIYEAVRLFGEKSGLQEKDEPICTKNS